MPPLFADTQGFFTVLPLVLLGLLAPGIYAYDRFAKAYDRKVAARWARGEKTTSVPEWIAGGTASAFALSSTAFLISVNDSKDLLSWLGGVLIVMIPTFFIFGAVFAITDRLIDGEPLPLPPASPPPDTAAAERRRQAEMAEFLAAPKVKQCGKCSSIAPEFMTSCPTCRASAEHLILIRADLSR